MPMNKGSEYKMLSVITSDEAIIDTNNTQKICMSTQEE